MGVAAAAAAEANSTRDNVVVGATTTAALLGSVAVFSAVVVDVNGTLTFTDDATCFGVDSVEADTVTDVTAGACWFAEGGGGMEEAAVVVFVIVSTTATFSSFVDSEAAACFTWTDVAVAAVVFGSKMDVSVPAAAK